MSDHRITSGILLVSPLLNCQYLFLSTQLLAWASIDLEGGDMKVGVLGSGDVAKVLAGGFLKHGHEVMMGTRAPEKLADWATENPGGRVGSFADAAKFADLAVLAVKGTAAADAVRAAGEAN